MFLSRRLARRGEVNKGDDMAQDESTQRGWDIGKMYDMMYSKLAEARNGMAGCLFTCHVKNT
jgi:hypothetical protein